MTWCPLSSCLCRLASSCCLCSVPAVCLHMCEEGIRRKDTGHPGPTEETVSVCLLKICFHLCFVNSLLDRRDVLSVGLLALCCWAACDQGESGRVNEGRDGFKSNVKFLSNADFFYSDCLHCVSAVSLFSSLPLSLTLSLRKHKQKSQKAACYSWKLLSLSNLVI